MRVSITTIGTNHCITTHWIEAETLQNAKALIADDERVVHVASDFKRNPAADFHLTANKILRPSLVRVAS